MERISSDPVRRKGAAMRSQERLEAAEKIMRAFAVETGLSSPKAPRRYLWTDAFAVCTYLALDRRTDDPAYRELALNLVDQVHHVLGRHREDDSRTGWISGLDEEGGEEHPTIGGLRIGKELNERRPDEPYNSRLEWDRDGQYFHYLTKWMHALNRVHQVTGDTTYHRWAVELAETAHKAFTYAPAVGQRRRMYWKMSIDLTYSLIPSMGHHDPLDGYLTYQELAAAAEDGTTVLAPEIAEMARICEDKSWATDDPLGLGGLLTDGYRALQLAPERALDPEDLPAVLFEAGHTSLRSYTQGAPFSRTPRNRLAFRELGLAIGLHAVEAALTWTDEHAGLLAGKDPVHARAEALTEYTPLADTIEEFWVDPTNQKAQSWTAHYDINRVMLATSLAPESYLAVVDLPTG